jgi:hypothetical protein
MQPYQQPGPPGPMPGAQPPGGKKNLMIALIAGGGLLFLLAIVGVALMVLKGRG